MLYVGLIAVGKWMETFNAYQTGGLKMIDVLFCGYTEQVYV
jgi:hypothetical protein